MVSPRPLVLLLATACSSAPTVDAPSALRVTRDATVCRVDDGTRPLLAYRFTGAKFKPYVERLFTPRGIQVLRDAPPDHVHHHGLMFALGLDDDIDFWGEVYVKNAGRQVGGPVRSRSISGPGGRASRVLEQSIEWLDGHDAKLVVHEERSIEVSELRANAPTLVTWRSRLALPPARRSVRIWGRHYFGLGMRFVASMDRTGRFLTPRGRVGELDELGNVVRGDERLVRSGWCAYVAECDGQTVTVAMFDHPDNPRHPATWFTMRKPFAYLAATLDLDAEPMQIDATNPLQLEYGIALWDGSIAAGVIEKTYRKWCTGR